MSLRIQASPSAEAWVTPGALGSPSAAQVVNAAPLASAGGAEPFRSALSALGREIDDGEKLVRRALTPSAGRLGAADLIALQAGIYRYSEAIDLAAKLVDRAGAAVRTTLQAGGQ